MVVRERVLRERKTIGVWHDDAAREGRAPSDCPSVGVSNHDAPAQLNGLRRLMSSTAIGCCAQLGVLIGKLDSHACHAMRLRNAARNGEGISALLWFCRARWRTTVRPRRLGVSMTLTRHAGRQTTKVLCLAIATGPEEPLWDVARQTMGPCR